MQQKQKIIKLFLTVVMLLCFCNAITDVVFAQDRASTEIKNNIENYKFNTSTALPGAATGALPDFAGKAIAIMLKLVATLGIAVIIYGGIRMITSFGSETSIKKGQGAFMQAILGTVIVLVAYIAISLIEGIIKGGSKPTAQQNIHSSVLQKEIVYIPAQNKKT